MKFWHLSWFEIAALGVSIVIFVLWVWLLVKLATSEHENNVWIIIVALLPLFGVFAYTLGIISIKLWRSLWRVDSDPKKISKIEEV